MTGLQDNGAADGRSIGPGSAHLAVRRPLLAIGQGAAHASRRLSITALALGYLGLVTILSTAPFWQQALAPAENRPLVCTDFGGSR